MNVESLPPDRAGDPSAARSYRRLALALLLLGLTVRLVLYLLCHPLFMDEAFLTLNLLDRDYMGLTNQLDRMQVAPVLFLWAELTVYRLFGASEWVLRLLPLLAGSSALVLFWRLARRAVDPMAAVIAVGLLALSRWPIHLSCQVKPYSFDLLVSVALLSAAIRWLRRPEKLGALVFLTLLVPIALAVSYPAVFVAGGISLVLLPAVWRHPATRVRSLFLGYNAFLLASFLLCDVVIGHRQYGEGNQVQDYMLEFWKRSFPPEGVAGLFPWLVRAHFGALMGYPYGNGNGSGLLTFPLFATGVWATWRWGRKDFAMLCLMPLALTLLAALLRRYPYGGCTRLSQHLAPIICLQIGVGAAFVAKYLARAPRVRLRIAWTVAGLFAVFAFANLILWTYRPYRDLRDLWAKRLAADVMARVPSDEPVLVLHPSGELGAVEEWYFRLHPNRVVWATGASRDGADESGWVLRLTPPGSTALFGSQAGPASGIDGRVSYTFRDPSQHEAEFRADLWRVGPCRP